MEKKNEGFGPIRVSSEIGRLRNVIIHRPGIESERVVPKKAKEWLYEDIVKLQEMRKEHDQFTNILRYFLGPDSVFESQKLLKEILDDPNAGKNLVISICAIEECTQVTQEYLLGMESETLAETLLSGFIEKTNLTIFAPIPNFVFTRDITAVVNEYIILSKPAKSARIREALIAKYIFRYHPYFVKSKQDIIELTNDEAYFLLNEEDREKEKVTIEGGDIMVLDKNRLLIGCGERTSPHAVKKIVSELFAKKSVRRIGCIYIPSDRSSMHLDTICTQISKNEYAVYGPLVYNSGRDSKDLRVEEYARNQDDEVSQHNYSSFQELLESINPGSEFIACGGGKSPYDVREQWTDGCNFLAIAPGVIIGYDRNDMTTNALTNKGYKPHKAEGLLEQFRKGEEDPEEIIKKGKTLILIPSAELSRARGGSHCMSLPLLRDEI